MPTYQNTIPLASDPPSIFPAQAQQNFQLIESVIGADHITFNTAGAGFHNKSTYVIQATDPGSLANQIVHYSKTVGTSTEEFIQRDGILGAIQLTSGLATNAGVFPSTGQTFLPGGIQMKWGSLHFGSATTITLTFVSVGLADFPANGLTGWTAQYSTPVGFNIINVNQTSIQISSTGSGDCLWFAIGN